MVIKIKHTCVQGPEYHSLPHFSSLAHSSSDVYFSSASHLSSSTFVAQSLEAQTTDLVRTPLPQSAEHYEQSTVKSGGWGEKNRDLNYLTPLGCIPLEFALSTRILAVLDGRRPGCFAALVRIHSTLD